MKRIIASLLVFSGFVLCTSAQDAPVGEVENAQIIIEKDKPLTLPKATKIYKPVEVEIVDNQASDLKFQVSEPTIELDPFESNIVVQPYQSVSKVIPKDGYLKVGFGNYLSPLVLGNYIYKDRKNRLSALVDIESFARGPVREEESAFSRMKLGATYDRTLKKMTLGSQVNYSREGYYFYGYDPESELVNPNPLLLDDKVAYNRFNFGLSAISTSKGDWSWMIKPSIELTNMQAESVDFNTEFIFNNQLGLTYDISKTLSVSLFSDYNFANYSSGSNDQRYVFSASPYAKWQNENLSIIGGVNVALSEDLLSKQTKVFPNIKAKWDASEELSINAEVSGNTKLNTLSQIQATNRYLNDSLGILNYDENIKVAIGGSYKISELMSIQPYVSYSNFTNWQFFAASANDSSRFELLTETGSFGKLTFGTAFNLVKGATQLSADFMFHSYQTDVLQEAWYLPTSQVSLHFDQLVGESLRIYSYLNFMNGIIGLNPTTLESINLNPILDMGIGINYRFNDSFSAFAEVKNVFGVEYEQYQNYPVRGITGKLGFIYRF
ncbi:MAG: hypothetical protein JXR10_01400 [Cyclobacteriaceae bacterium]